MTTGSGHPVITIDEDACTGCGLCVTECAEGAIEIVDGKARVVGEWLCDGIGHCVGACPAGALSVEMRDHAPGPAENTESLLIAEESAGSPANRGDATGGASSDATAGDSVCACSICGSSEEAATLVAIRAKGESGWCCTRCLPSLIHS